MVFLLLKAFLYVPNMGKIVLASIIWFRRLLTKIIAHYYYYYYYYYSV